MGGPKYNVRFLHQIGQLYLEPRNVLTYCKLLPPLLLLPFKSQVASQDTRSLLVPGKIRRAAAAAAKKQPLQKVFLRRLLAKD